MNDATPRLKLPMIRPGQAQKELSHNEALVAVDMLTHAGAIAIGLNSPPTTPQIGQSWIVGTAPTDDWAEKAGYLAGWSDAGWRFVQPVEGMTVWVVQETLYARFSGENWRLGEVCATRLLINGQPVVGARGAPIAEPAGGSLVDAQARASIIMVLAALRSHGLIES